METSINEPKKKGGVAKWAIIFAIVIVLNLFFNYAISLVYKAPQYNDFVKPTQIVQNISNKDDCIKIGGQWTEADARYQGMAIDAVAGTKPVVITGSCDQNWTNQNNFDKAQKEYNRNVFIILVVLSAIVLVLSAVLKNEILALAFSWGGVLCLIIASMRYWSDANDLFRVLILALALGLLIWVAIKKFGK